MEVPLLEDQLELIGGDGDYREPKGLKEWWMVVWIETVKLWGIGGPIAFNIICQFSTSSATTMFVGRIGDVELSAVSISLSVIGCFSFGFLLGMGSALETLCGQAFGARQVHMLGVYMQRSIIILFVTCILLLPIYLFATPLLILLGQQPEIADLAGYYTMLIIPQLFSLAIIFPTQKFLQAQSKVGLLTWIGFIDLVMHVFLLWLFIHVLGWGTTGAAVAYNISNWVLALAQLAYVVGWCKDGWKGLSWSALNEIWAFVRLSVASAVMLCLEIWYMMSVTILTGHLNNAVAAVGSLTICMNINGWEAMIFIGINAAISVRVSNELGSGHPRATKYVACVTVVQSLLIGILCMIVVLATREHLTFIFTDSPDLHQAVSRLAPLLGVTMVLNSVQPVISGVAVGGGWQALVAYINLGSYYIFGLPLGFFLGYTFNLGVMGLWGGMIAGTTLQTLVLLFVLYRTNWKNEVKLSSERMRKWGGQNIEPEILY
ncbi:transporter [Lithospermum erythrorhizon]|uniref:Protein DETOXIFICATION n=1 Tax=Lithospermum erythrorhizon TaxID=34254 RepID=A0AAV3QT13_LITER